MLAGIVLLILGLLDYGSDRGRAMLICGMLLGSLGGLDTALREHPRVSRHLPCSAIPCRPRGHPLLRRSAVAGRGAGLPLGSAAPHPRYAWFTSPSPRRPAHTPPPGSS